MVPDLKKDHIREKNTVIGVKEFGKQANVLKNRNIKIIGGDFKMAELPKTARKQISRKTGGNMNKYVNVRAREVENGFVVTRTDEDYKSEDFIAQSESEAQDLVNRLAGITE